jgi:4'-phosphopantetheinyl transferase
VKPQNAPAARPGDVIRTLPGDEIHLHITSPDSISDPALLNRFESLLSADEQARMRRFHSDRRRRQYLVSRALLRTSLSSYHAVEPAAWRFEKNGYGKPEISHPDASLPIRFNLSHADGLSVCAIANGREIGVDIEDCYRATRASLLDLGRYFSTQEAMVLRALPKDQLADRFFDYWTLKEAYIKARGAGFAIPLDTFSFSFMEDTLTGEDRLTGFSVHAEVNDEAGRWQFRRMRLASRYRIALAVELVEPVERVEPEVKMRVFRSAPWCDEMSLPLKEL